MVESAKTTVGPWSICEIIEAMAESSLIANPAVRMLNQNAQIAGFSPEVVHVDGMRICKVSPTKWQLIELVFIKTSPAWQAGGLASSG